MSTKSVRALALSLLLGLGLSACSTVSDYGPTAFVDADEERDDRSEFPTFGVMESNVKSAMPAEDTAGTADSEPASATPEPATFKEKLDKRRGIAKSLVGDYKGAQYTNEVLRGDMDMSAPAPTDIVRIASVPQTPVLSQPDQSAQVVRLRVPTAPKIEGDVVTAMGGPYIPEETIDMDGMVFEDTALLLAPEPAERVNPSLEPQVDGGYALDVAALRQDVYAQKLAQSAPQRLTEMQPVAFAESSAPPIPDRVARILDERPIDDEQAALETSLGQDVVLARMNGAGLVTAERQIAATEKPDMPTADQSPEPVYSLASTRRSRPSPQNPTFLSRNAR